ncbi:DUF4412 domain-containing protein [Sulfurovum sp.]|uniref:DUF4412 domain-containing protein n=1 Tax=Sulfurovum sp. TaxID=1969726 RepID=UPI0035639B80
MKQMKLWGVVFTLILVASILQAETKRYEVKSGIIEYTVKGGGDMMGIQTQIEGTSKALFNNWGNVELHKDTTKTLIMGREEHTRQTTKIENGQVYVVDYEQKVIVQYDPSTLMQSEHKDLAKSSKEMILAMGGKKIGEESIQGYDCEVWETPQIKLWLHKGVLLKSEANIMGITHSTEATNINLDASVSDEDLKLPDFPIQTMEESMKNNNSNMPQMTPEQMQQMQEMMKSFTQK